MTRPRPTLDLWRQAAQAALAADDYDQSEWTHCVLAYYRDLTDWERLDEGPRDCEVPDGPAGATIRRLVGCSAAGIAEVIASVQPDGTIDLQGADLRKADLEGADLRKADLSGANLRGANLRDADLRRANLSRARLQGADLRKAELEDADLRGARLRRADLQDAVLSADLRRADLSGANLQDAVLGGALRSPDEPKIPGWTVVAGLLQAD